MPSYERAPTLPMRCADAMMSADATPPPSADELRRRESDERRRR